MLRDFVFPQMSYEVNPILGQNVVLELVEV